MTTPSFGAVGDSSFAAAAKDALDRHGYSFQYAVLSEFARLTETERRGWSFNVSEFPVSTGGYDTRIDFVCSHSGAHLLLVGECKRVNPRLADWMFVRSQWRATHPSEYHVALEHVKGGAGNPAGAKAHVAEPTENSYDVAVEVKGRAPGHSTGAGGREALEAACTQVTRAQQGYINFLASMSSKGGPWNWFVIPALFTNAQLWAGTPNLAASSLDTGKLPEPPHVTLQPWLWYQFPVSRSLWHDLSRRRPKSDQDALLYHHTRSVAVVNSRGISHFLRYLATLRLYPEDAQ